MVIIYRPTNLLFINYLLYECLSWFIYDQLIIVILLHSSHVKCG